VCCGLCVPWHGKHPGTVCEGKKSVRSVGQSVESQKRAKRESLSFRTDCFARPLSSRAVAARIRIVSLIEMGNRRESSVVRACRQKPTNAGVHRKKADHVTQQVPLKPLCRELGAAQAITRSSSIPSRGRKKKSRSRDLGG